MISCCMIVQDEELCITRAIESVHDFDCISEIVVLDGGSTDNTKMLATKYAKVKFHEFLFRPSLEDDIEMGMDDQKNRAIALAVEDWILFVDADEYYEPYVLQSLPTLVQSEYDAFRFSRRNFIGGILTNLYTYDYQVRLFKRYCKYKGKIHEGVVGYKNSTEVNLTIMHVKTGDQQLLDDMRCWDLGQQPFPGWEKIEGKWVYTGGNK